MGAPPTHRKAQNALRNARIPGSDKLPLSQLTFRPPRGPRACLCKCVGTNRRLNDLALPAPTQHVIREVSQFALGALACPTLSTGADVHEAISHSDVSMALAMPGAWPAFTSFERWQSRRVVWLTHAHPARAPIQAHGRQAAAARQPHSRFTARAPPIVQKLLQPGKALKSAPNAPRRT